MISIDDITILLNDAQQGRAEAMDELMRLIYDDLERLARSQLNRKFGDHADRLTLEPAALVNESFLRLIRQRSPYDNRGQFFSIATRVMMRVLLDYRRERMAQKRGGDRQRITLSLAGDDVAAHGPGESLVSLEDLAAALERLEALDQRKADIVKMRVIWSMPIAEIAAALEVSHSTVDRDWKFARAWIADEVGLAE